MQTSNIEIEGLSIAIREAGPAEAPAFLLLHGWPQSSYAFEGVIGRLAAEYRVVAPDLPCIGGSQGMPEAGDKRTLARLMRGVAEACGLRHLVAAGHDVGGQIVFALLRDHPEILSGAAIMDVAVPGVAPWEEVIRNPRIWHFAFHAVPALPETLVSGHQSTYFDFFFNVLSKDRASIPAQAREIYARAYSRPESLQAGFDWYRAFPEDAKANAARPAAPTAIPVLYLRGSAESGDIGDYVEGLRAAGLSNVEGDIIADSGHFIADENPEALAARLARFHREIGAASASLTSRQA
ncbi:MULTISPECIES: alpha/beta hydrolase [unclassified Mesorhizobium]|uniref:alpha/beta fold hydrolase n=1 Tax=unclassified Mesorhizobium TaxID=325217 RepID=UPI00112D9961|nr:MULTISPECIES: alpha/beta hydrolase [unclassified Mesorhizobium]MCA0057589.1 alpha/beta hydrolase [Mesorhizobium sp. B261B1A]TPL07256.1 alpha/beta hydrolase [Mesorhizobium sp. B2-4-11]